MVFFKVCLLTFLSFCAVSLSQNNNEHIWYSKYVALGECIGPKDYNENVETYYCENNYYATPTLTYRQATKICTEKKRFSNKLRCSTVREQWTKLRKMDLQENNDIYERVSKDNAIDNCIGPKEYEDPNVRQFYCENNYVAPKLTYEEATEVCIIEKVYEDLWRCSTLKEQDRRLRKISAQVESHNENNNSN